MKKKPLLWEHMVELRFKDDDPMRSKLQKGPFDAGSVSSSLKVWLQN